MHVKAMHLALTSTLECRTQQAGSKVFQYFQAVRCSLAPCLSRYGLTHMSKLSAARDAAAAKPAPSRPAKRARRSQPEPVGMPSATAANAGLIRAGAHGLIPIKSSAGHDAYIAYHDNEWGRPTHDDAKMFELVTLESAQAGLSWSTILRKHDAYRTAFGNFDAAAVAAFDADAAVERLMAEGSGIVRHEGKIRAAISNARCFVKVQEEHGGSFADFAWSFVPEGKPICNSWHEQHEMPTRSAEGDALCAALKKKGFKFFGPTISYTFLQAAGLVNDHLVSCHCYQNIKDSYDN